jgi:hypothetical protein
MPSTADQQQQSGRVHTPAGAKRGEQGCPTPWTARRDLGAKRDDLAARRRIPPGRGARPIRAPPAPLLDKDEYTPQAAVPRRWGNNGMTPPLRGQVATRLQLIACPFTSSCYLRGPGASTVGHQGRPPRRTASR